jgi:hypothetical protein
VVAAERKTPGSGGQNSGAEKRFQDQAVNTEKKEQKKRMKQTK